MQNLANPKAANYVPFYPQVCLNDLVQDFRHGDKWLFGWEADLRAQMVHTGYGHFYLYEPVQLKNGRVVNHTHLHYFDNILMAKALPVEIRDFPDSSTWLKIPPEKSFTLWRK